MKVCNKSVKYKALKETVLWQAQFNDDAKIEAQICLRDWLGEFGNSNEEISRQTCLDRWLNRSKESGLQTTLDCWIMQRGGFYA